MKKAGIKYDKEKLRWDLLPLGPIRIVIRVLMHGSRKYADDNWKKVSNARDRYYNAAMRHLTAHRDGEFVDKESGLPHLAHCICCLIFLLWIDLFKAEEGRKKP